MFRRKTVHLTLAQSFSAPASVCLGNGLLFTLEPQGDSSADGHGYCDAIGNST